MGLVRKWKVALAVAVVVLLYWFVFRRRGPPPGYLCDQLFAKVHKHVVPDAFDGREETYVAIWASNGAHERETCSYYSFHRSKPFLHMGNKNLSGETINQFVAFSKREDGVIQYFPRDDPTNILGFIYPIFFDEHAPTLGNVECVEKNGFAEWKTTLAVPLQLYRHPTTEHFVNRGIEAFKRIASEIGVDVHLGRNYDKVCWKGPTWSQSSKGDRSV